MKLIKFILLVYAVLIFQSLNCAVPDQLIQSRLYYAVINNNVSLIKQLKKEGADLNRQDSTGHTLLFWIMHENTGSGTRHLESIKDIQVLLDHGADPKIANKAGRTPFCCVRNVDHIRLLQKAGGAPTVNDICFFLKNGYQFKHDLLSLLIPAISTDRLEQRRVLTTALSCEKNSQKTCSALHMAKDVTTVKILLKCGALVDVKDKDNQTVLHYDKSLKALKLLIAYGADVRAKDIYGKTPLHRVHSCRAVKALLKAGADPNAQDNNGDVVIHEVIRRHRLGDGKGLKTIRALILAGADFLINNNAGKNLLLEASDADIINVCLQSCVERTMNSFAL
jgi:ankyrin repeat protein